MLKQQRCVFALVRSLEDLERAGEDLAGLLAILDNRDPGEKATDSLLGIWVDAQGAANMPCALDFEGRPEGGRSLRIVEAMGVNGVWMLCFLDAPDGPPSRADLVGALLVASGYEGEPSVPGRFIPVFGRDAQASHGAAEMESLESRYPDLLLAPVHRDPAGGKFCLQPGLKKGE